MDGLTQPRFPGRLIPSKRLANREMVGDSTVMCL